MKKKQNSIAALFMGLVLFMGYMLPTMVTAVEDHHLLKEKKEYEIEEIKLNSTELDFYEELVLFPELIDRELKVKRNEVEEEGSWIYDRAKEIVSDFLFMLNAHHTIVFEKFSVISVAMVDWNGENVYPLWRCQTVDENEKEFVFWIDEITGKVVAFDTPDYVLTLVNGNAMDTMMEVMAEYYGLVINENLGNWYDVNGYDVKAASNVEGIFYFLNEEDGRELYLPFLCYGERMVFNMYIGEVSVYNFEQQLSDDI